MRSQSTTTVKLNAIWPAETPDPQVTLTRSGSLPPTSGSTRHSDMFHRRKIILLALAPMLFHAPAQAFELDSPNVVQVSPNLITSGQPTPGALAKLGKLGIQAVIYLAPDTVHDAVRDEPQLLRQQGIEYIHIPIPFEAPSESDFVAVSSALDHLNGKKVLVHCQVNMRASTMVFLYRAITLHEDPALAYESVSRVWSPEGAWKQLVVGLLKRHGIPFQPL